MPDIEKGEGRWVFDVLVNSALRVTPVLVAYTGVFYFLRWFNYPTQHGTSGLLMSIEQMAAGTFCIDLVYIIDRWRNSVVHVDKHYNKLLFDKTRY